MHSLTSCKSFFKMIGALKVVFVVAVLLVAANALMVSDETAYDYVEWVQYNRSTARKFFTNAEWPSIPSTHYEAKCPIATHGGGPGDDRQCCIGSYSKGGGLKWQDQNCYEDVASYCLIPKKKDGTRFKTMNDVLRLINPSQKLTLTGDSLMSQFMGAMECSWQRQHNYELTKDKEWVKEMY